MHIFIILGINKTLMAETLMAEIIEALTQEEYDGCNKSSMGVLCPQWMPQTLKVKAKSSDPVYISLKALPCV